MKILSSEFVSIFNSDYRRNNRSKSQKSIRCFPRCGRNGHTNKGFCGCQVVVEVAFARREFDQFKGKLYFVGEIHPSHVQSWCRERPVTLSSISRQVQQSHQISPVLIDPSTAPEIDVLPDIVESRSRLFIGKPIGLFLSSAGGVRTWYESSTVVDDSSTSKLNRTKRKAQLSSSKGKYVVMVVAFNSGLNSWDYNWKSNRWNKEKSTFKHVFEATVLVGGSVPSSLDSNDEVLSFCHNIASSEFGITSNRGTKSGAPTTTEATDDGIIVTSSQCGNTNDLVESAVRDLPDGDAVGSDYAAAMSSTEFDCVGTVANNQGELDKQITLFDAGWEISYHEYVEFVNDYAGTRRKPQPTAYTKSDELDIGGELEPPLVQSTSEKLTDIRKRKRSSK